MARIGGIVNDDTINNEDKLLGTNQDGVSKNYLISDVTSFIVEEVSAGIADLSIPVAQSQTVRNNNALDSTPITFWKGTQVQFDALSTAEQNEFDSYIIS